MVNIVSLTYTTSTATLFALWQVDLIQGNQFPHLTCPDSKLSKKLMQDCKFELLRASESYASDSVHMIPKTYDKNPGLI